MLESFFVLLFIDVIWEILFRLLIHAVRGIWWVTSWGCRVVVAWQANRAREANDGQPFNNPVVSFYGPVYKK